MVRKKLFRNILLAVLGVSSEQLCHSTLIAARRREQADPGRPLQGLEVDRKGPRQEDLGLFPLFLKTIFCHLPEEWKDCGFCFVFFCFGSTGV
jgi:hypothetical protein